MFKQECHTVKWGKIVDMVYQQILLFSGIILFPLKRK